MDLNLIFGIVIALILLIYYANKSASKPSNDLNTKVKDDIKKSSLEFQTTDLIAKTYNINWVNGLVPYDGAKLMKKDFQLNNSLNVPALFSQDGSEYIMIKVTTEKLAKKLIDKIIDENGGFDEFSEGSSSGWMYLQSCDSFTIGYLTQHMVIRLNKHD